MCALVEVVPRAGSDAGAAVGGQMVAGVHGLLLETWSGGVRQGGVGLWLRKVWREGWSV